MKEQLKRGPSLMSLLEEYDNAQQWQIQKLRERVELLEDEKAELLNQMVSGINTRDNMMLTLMASGALKNPHEAAVSIDEDTTLLLLELLRAMMYHYHPSPNTADTRCEFCNETSPKNGEQVQHRSDCDGVAMCTLLQGKYDVFRRRKAYMEEQSKKK